MHIAEGKKITVVAPEGGLVKDVPVLYGSLIIVPHMTVSEGHRVTARYTGLFSGPVKAGDTPEYKGEPAFYEGNTFTKTKPTTNGAVSQPVGVFIDDCVLLTGELITDFVPAT